MQQHRFTALLTAILLAGCHSDGSSDNTPAQQTKHVELSAQRIQIIDESKLALDAPGITIENAASVSDISSNFGHAEVNTTTGKLNFSPSYVSTGTMSARSTTAANMTASEQNYKFEIHYQIGEQTYQVTGYALPLFKDEQGQVSTRFSKVSLEGTPLPAEEQVLTKQASDWACIVDASSELTWQVPQSNGSFAFDATYYWGDRTINHRDFATATCHLTGDCNTDSLIEIANQQQLCGHSDWRLPTRNEWKTLLTADMFDNEKRLSPIDRFFFPYMDANFDEAYWTAIFTQYKDGHDADAIDGDWQGSNSTVGDAYVMWMSDDFAYEKMPPRSTNEPRLSMLVRGDTIPDEIDTKPDEVEIITVDLKQEINVDGNEDDTWQDRFVKLGKYGQPLQDQTALEWQCTQDNHYAAVLPGINILWQRVTPEASLMTYAQAEAYVSQINQATLCGRDDWRLPTEKELKSLLIDTFEFNLEGAFFRAGYTDTILNDTVVGFNSYYWTQTESLHYPGTRAAVAFQSEGAESSFKADTSLFRVRLISTSHAQ